MIDAFWFYFKSMDPWYMGSIFLGLFAIGVALPLRAILFHTGGTRVPHAKIYILIAPVVEELAFRVAALTVLAMLFGPLVGIVLMTAGYMIYTGLFYGPPYAADGLVLGLLFGFAVFELGIVPVILAHMFYRFVLTAW